MRSQEVKEGYKLTEFGVIPEDWDVKMLKDLASLIIDGTHKTPQYQAYGVPFLRVTDLKSNKIDVRNLKFISKEEHKFLQERCKPEKGDLLLSKNGTIGVPKAINWDWEFSIFVSLALIKIRPQKINLYFLEQFIKSNFLDQQIKQRSKQGTVTNLHLEEIREFLIPLPPTLEEQEKIAQVLSDFDSAIAHLDKLINKKRNVKQGTMQQLLTGKQRLPGFSGEWKVKKLGEILDYIKGFAFNSSEYKNNGVRIIRISDTTYDSIKEENPVYIKTNQALNFEKWKLKENDIILSTVGSKPPLYESMVGRVILVSQKYEGSLLNQNAVLLREKFNNVAKQRLIYFNLKMKRYLDYIEKIFRGNANQASITLFDLFDFTISLPSLPEEQQAIAQVLSDMDAEIEALEKKRDKYQAMKQGMMQELLTGKTRLIDQN